MQFSPVIAGCMKWGEWGARFTEASYTRMIETCAENGISSFDHADIYGDYTSEEEFGNALRQLPALRSRIQLISKCGIKMVSPNRPAHKIKSYDTGYAYIIGCAERSLKNLRTDYLDLFLIHRPDPLMNPDEIAEAFTKLKKEGKVLHTGVSNFTPSQVQLLHTVYPVEVNQIEISVTSLAPFHNGQLDQCLEQKILPMAWSPLGGGSLFTGSADRKYQNIFRVAAQLSIKYSIAPENIFLAFLRTHPSGILPVLGTSKINRLLSAMEAATLKLEREEWFMLWEASKGHAVP